MVALRTTLVGGLDWLLHVAAMECRGLNAPLRFEAERKTLDSQRWRRSITVVRQEKEGERGRSEAAQGNPAALGPQLLAE